MAIALLKLVQGASVGGNGEALKGAITTPVALSNVDNTGVGSWELELLEKPYSSALALGVLASANGSTPSSSFVPDVIGGCYRLQLKVWPQANKQGIVDTDIRNFGINGTNGVCVPPPQVWPLALPDPRTGLPGAKPNEMNFAGQDDGWAGNGNDGLLRYALRVLGTAIGSGDVVGPAVSVANDIPLYSDTTGKLLKDTGVSVASLNAYADAPQGSVALTFGASGNVDGTAFTVPASPSGVGRFVLSRVVVRLATLLTGSGSVAVTVGTSAGGAQFITSTTVNNGNALGVLAGASIASLGASFLANQGYEAILDAGATVVVRCATTGTVTAGGVKVYVYGYFLP